MNITSVNGQELYQMLFGRETTERVKLVPLSTDSKGAVDRFELEHFESTPSTSSVSSLFETGDGLYSFKMRLNLFKTDDEFARHYGAIGKRLDDAYASGKITEREYNELNSSLSDYISEMKDKNDNRRAELEMTNSRMFGENKMTGDPETDKEIMDRFLAEKQKAINSILNRAGFVTQFAKIMEMVNHYRYC